MATLTKHILLVIVFQVWAVELTRMFMPLFANFHTRPYYSSLYKHVHLYERLRRMVALRHIYDDYIIMTIMLQHV